MNLRQPLTDLVYSPDDERALARWTTEVGRAFPPLQMTSTDSPFGAHFRTVGASDFQLSDMEVSPHEVVRAPGTAKDVGTEY